MKNLIGIGLVLISAVLSIPTYAAEHVYCRNESGSLTAKIIYFGELSPGNGFITLTKDGHFLDPSDPNARTFSKILHVGGGVKVLLSAVQPETLVIDSGLKKLSVFGAAGQFEDFLNCD